MNIFNGIVVRLLIYVRGLKFIVFGICFIYMNINMVDMILFFWIKMYYKLYLNFYRMLLKMLKVFLCKDGLIIGIYDVMY